MTAKVSIIIGSKSDFNTMEAALKMLNDFEVPFELHILSAHRTPNEVENLARGSESRGIKVIIAGAGMAAHLAGVIAANTIVPVVGVPLSASLQGIDSLLAIVQMPQGIPVATVGINAAANAALLAVQILSVNDDCLKSKLYEHKEKLKESVINANEFLKDIIYKYKVN
jgi:5-(carboxyamino)imidazole ribonucleotide mutase